jgi:hypothetical protein
MEHSRRQHPASFVLRYLQRRRHAAGYLIGPERMLHAGVVRAWEHQVREAELVHPVKALHLRPLEQVQVDTAQLDAAVDAVMDDLRIWHRRKIGIGLYIGFEKLERLDTGTIAPV